MYRLYITGGIYTDSPSLIHCTVNRLISLLENPGKLLEIGIAVSLLRKKVGQRIFRIGKGEHRDSLFPVDDLDVELGILALPADEEIPIARIGDDEIALLPIKTHPTFL